MSETLQKLRPHVYGVSVRCVVCHRTKAPRGRSVSIYMVNGMCTGSYECEGYEREPHIGSLWPDESEADFGYPVGNIGIREVPHA